MTIRRSAAAVGAVALGFAALSACTKPTPLATVTVGTDSVHTEAACYNDGKPLTPVQLQTCLSRKPGDTVTVHETDTLRVGVDPAVADKGWVLAIDAQPKTSLIKDTYRTFGNVSQIFTDAQTGNRKKSVTMSVVETGNGKALGAWNITLKLAN